MIKSICLVRLSALGDVMMFVPLVRALQRALPDAKLTWIISPLAYSLIEDLDGVEFIVLDKPKSLKDYWQFWRRIRKYQFDVLIAAQASLRANCLYPLISAKRKIGYDRARAKDGHRYFVKEHITPGREHTLEGFLKFGEAIGVPKAPPEWHLPIQDEAYDWARRHIGNDSRPIFLINPAASKSERTWYAPQYIEVIQFIQARFDVHIILIGGPGAEDKALGDAIAEAVSVTNLIGQSKPKQLLALIDLAVLLLCPDTGPAHIASAVNTKVLALHAVTNPDISAPYLSRDIAINMYPEALKRHTSQPVEKARWGTQVRTPWAMQLVSVDTVIEKLGQLLPTML